MAKFSEKLDKICAERQWSNRQLAEMLDVHHATVGSWRRGERLPTLDVAVKLADKADVSLDFLARDTLETDPEKEFTEDDQNVLRLVRFFGSDVAWRILRDAVPENPGSSPLRPEIK